MKNKQKLKISQMPCCIYKLHTKDSLIYTDNHNYQRNIFIVQGAILVVKVFTNQEIVPISILDNHSIIFIKSYSFNLNNYYYKATALKETYLLTLKANYISSSIIHPYLMKAIYNTITKQILIAQILLHKEAKNRTLQIIIYLSEHFGYVENGNLIIDLQINYNLLALMTGTNKNSIRKILNNLENKILIKTHRDKILYITQYKKATYKLLN
uniref:Global nitrogen transcriptional regulator n=1 Tax=Gastroclonium compressum TaxID=1852973 RepID=A0A173G0A0_GASCM|nr:global nitrogen transcriptional regulator [Coeloseira compressa]ANH09705.1 global nitrogen transcriptional regulator [Coeloseira compressa]